MVVGAAYAAGQSQLHGPVSMQSSIIIRSEMTPSMHADIVADRSGHCSDMRISVEARDSFERTVRRGGGGGGGHVAKQCS